MTHIPRVVITGITLGGQDVVDILRTNPKYVTVHQVVEDLPYSLTPTQAATLRSEAIAILTKERASA
jgi:hypothetical protein